MKIILLVTALILFTGQVNAQKLSEQLVYAAIDRTELEITYDGRYIAIDYPNGDVPAEIGVCTDVVIRSYRELGIDLQQLVHEDMRDNFELYPSKRIWGLTSTDRNIDHRRVPNLQTFFKRQGESLSISENPEHYQPGDIVSWMLPGNLPHIGIVTNQKNPDNGNPLIVHNIGAGPKLEDMLFDYDITGHYRYFPQTQE
ncbi:DUF1287 domain-containing protein [Kangiella koreensis]|uniref:DUF1287 domain-containing protein n=1 Tax=Kangiella koreensis (strain DSM 16069 / JCM 12317 / KCTC 12182 / SW-125) TaxID=523791 RepID=C7R6L2_KANKD|nr:DUF1287 domain-containing protein [Kangiella koreensis]ACV25528.1 protein of unknown function DUF1287 [Kangiella koreensis DSM 16069]